MNGFITISRALFESEAWKKATLEQKGAMFDICSRAAFCDHACKLDGNLSVTERADELITTNAQLQAFWHVDYNTVRRLKRELSCLGFVSLRVLVEGFVKRSVLKVSDLIHLAGQGGGSGDGSLPNKGKKKEGKKEIIPPNPQKGETGGEVLSSDEKKSSRRKSVKQKVKDRYKELEKKWMGYISDGKVMKTDGQPFCNQERFKYYLPAYQTYVFNNSGKNIDVNDMTSFPLAGNMDSTQRIEFLELHVCHFIATCGIDSDMQREEIAYLAYDLSVQCSSLNVLQVSRFFYCMHTSDSSVGSPVWNKLSSQKINAALKKFKDWCVQNK